MSLGDDELVEHREAEGTHRLILIICILMILHRAATSWYRGDVRTRRIVVSFGVDGTGIRIIVMDIGNNGSGV